MTKEGERPKIGAVRAFVRLFPMCLRAHPVLFLATHVLGIAHGLAWAIGVPLQQRFFDAAEGMTRGNVALSAVIVALLLMGGMYVMQQVLNGVANFVPGIYSDKARGVFGRRIHAHIAELSAEAFEDTDALEDINKAYEGMGESIWYVQTILMVLTFYLPYFAYLGFYLFRLKPILALSVGIIFLPAALTQIVRANVFAKLEDASAPIRREMEHYERCIVDRAFFKETRLLGGFAYFHRLFVESLALMNRLKLRASVRSDLFELSMKVSAVAGYVGILWMLFDALMAGEITVGAFAAVFASIGNLVSIMEEVVCGHMSNLAKQQGMVSNFLRFLDLPARGGADVAVDVAAGFDVQDVSFSYPRAEAPALQGVSFTVAPAETIAIVGENGSGKSTLVKLLLGLYAPTSGEVRIGGVSTRDASMRSLASRMSAVFQTYQRYKMTLAENVGISDVRRDADEPALDDAAARAGVDAQADDYPAGYDTMLAREFDGVDLSGGQWQRVAIARGLYRAHDAIALDEPTAAIDPLEETRVYARFAEGARGKTAFIVTHRLGSARLADRILVMRAGALVESGTHDELLRADGEYARLYRAQEQWYR